MNYVARSAAALTLQIKVSPPKKKLVEKFNVSRGTIREAVNLLIQEKLLERQWGKGTFVTTPQSTAQKTTLVFSYADAYSLRHPYLSSLYHAFEERVKELAVENGQAEMSVQCIRQPKIANSNDYTLLNTEDSFQKQILNPSCVQGLCLTTSIPDKELLEIQKRGIACVELDGCKDSINPTVYIDRFTSKKLGITYLRDLGHRHIGFVCTKDTEIPFEQEVMGRLLEFGKKSGLTINSCDKVVCDDWDREAARRAVKPLLMSSERPTALFCFDDYLALGVWDAAKDLGISVPGDLSLVGMGNFEPYSGLTTVSTPLKQMAQKGAEMLTGAISQTYDGPSHVCLDGCELNIRQSSGPKPVLDSKKKINMLDCLESTGQRRDYQSRPILRK